MTADDFETVLDGYFQGKQAWTLTEALYLAIRIDPQNQPPIDDGVSDADGLARLYKLSRKAIKAAELSSPNATDEKLLSLDFVQGAVGADRYVIDPRDFVKWIGTKSPAYGHLTDAEARYSVWKKQRTRKSFKDLEKSQRDSEISQAVIEIDQSGDIDLREDRMISAAARLVTERLSKRYTDVVGQRTIRNHITALIEEGLERN